MRSYIALSGRDGAFGWNRRREDGRFQVSLGGLIPGETYVLAADENITADANGRWQGERQEPLRFASLRGKVILCDENSMTWEEAALMAQPKKVTQIQQVFVPEEKAEEVEEEIKAEVKEEFTYRTRLNGHPVDELPCVSWPRGYEKIRACFEKGIPVRVLPYPWRFVRVPGTRGEGMIGYLMENDRITKTASAVRAKGGLLQPKGLNGYDYVRTDTGEGYWMLIQRVR